MKRFLICLMVLLFSNVVFASENPHNAIYNNNLVYYNPLEAKWSNTPSENDIVLKKELIEGTGSYSIYKYDDSRLAFALSTDFEIISNGKLITIDNNLLGYNKIVYDGEQFIQTSLTEEEIQETFPNAELFKLSQIDDDNKIWLHKPLFKKRTLLLINDSDKYYHSISTKSKKVQDPEIKGLITIARYGILTFRHLGERNGKLIIYIR